MNIFILDNDISKSANYLDNTRCVKMILETAQIISTVLSKKGITGFYKPTHHNHPCVLWAGESSGNLFYLWSYLRELLLVYKNRYKKNHVVDSIMQRFRVYIREGETTSFVLCMPSEFKTNNVVESYRNFYCSKPLVRYFYNDIPDWFLEKRKTPFYVSLGKKYELL